ncbi:2-phosphosulfolactate phosphatase [Leifsonia sp. AG29]|uniref:2-phosphosulfolactate phosphatase n=1 Tax=Leifsonia sp. AG29 TaxID=2598860 RepID=UPI00131E4FA7|nr:2-phosphosulfolactate phosphatase [Leifsonia sp. AG29]
MTDRQHPTPVPDAFAQAKYQVRFDWAAEGAETIAADADVVAWVDVLDGPDPLDLPPSLARATGAALLRAGFADAPAVARWILDEQVRLGRRAMVSLVAAGGRTPGGATRFAVEDLLAAGALVDALASVGIDYASPEAAAACASFTGLRGAVAHLLTASASGQALIAAGADPADIAALGRVGTRDDVTVLRSSTAG